MSTIDVESEARLGQTGWTCLKGERMVRIPIQIWAEVNCMDEEKEREDKEGARSEPFEMA